MAKKLELYLPGTYPAQRIDGKTKKASYMFQFNVGNHIIYFICYFECKYIIIPQFAVLCFRNSTFYYICKINKKFSEKTSNTYL